MTDGEKLILDSLVNISKSMSRMADELQRIRETFETNQRMSLSESRKKRHENRGIVLESSKTRVSGEESLSKKSPLENIHDILEGKYLS